MVVRIGDAAPLYELFSVHLGLPVTWPLEVAAFAEEEGRVEPAAADGLTLAPLPHSRGHTISRGPAAFAMILLELVQKAERSGGSALASGRF